MKVLCRHIRCDRSLIFTPEALELRVSRNFYLLFKHVPQSWKNKFCKWEARKWQTDHSPFWLTWKKKREASSRERFGTGKKGERSISGTHNFQSKVPAGKRDYLFWNSFFPRHFLVERTKKSCSIYKRTSISVNFLWIVNSHYLQTHGTATRSKTAGSYANIFMAQIE